MAGTTLTRQLSTRRSFGCSVAEASDDVAIRRLLRENPMPGPISISLEREPNYFRGANIAGGTDVTIVGRSGSQLRCLGRCTQRESWLNGAAKRVGYLAELRLDA